MVLPDSSSDRDDNRRLETLLLNKNIIKALRNRGIETIGELAEAAQLSDRLLQIRGIGETYLDEIRDLLRHLGYPLPTRRKQ